MADQPTSKSITLEISWKNHLIGYLLSVIFIPVFGIGLIGLFWVWKRQHRISYRVTDTQITSKDDEYQRNIDLVNIQRVSVSQGWLQKKLGVGDISLKTSSAKMVLFGMENPFHLKGLLDKAITAEKERQRQDEKKPEVQEPDYDPGSMEKMNYLTGLWQQGLISDDDYEEERKHFE